MKVSTDIDNNFGDAQHQETEAIDRQPSEPTPIEIDDSITTSNTTETFETTDTDTDSNLSESTVNTETSFQESSNTRAETDVLPVIEERTGELSPERTRQQGPEEEDEDEDKDEDEDNTVFRKSARRRNKPAWMKTGEYVMLQQPDWMRKAEYLKGLAFSGMFPSSEKDIGKALLKLVTENI